jgi:hypothetical protein
MGMKLETGLHEEVGGSSLQLTEKIREARDPNEAKKGMSHV